MESAAAPLVVALVQVVQGPGAILVEGRPSRPTSLVELRSIGADAAPRAAGARGNPRAGSDARLHDSRFVSTYQLTHCNPFPSSPVRNTDQSSPEQYDRRSGAYQDDYSREYELDASPVRETPCYIPDFSPTRGSRERLDRATEAFAESLRKYPLPEDGCPSSDLVRRYLAFAHAKHLADAENLTRSPRSLIRRTERDGYKRNVHPHRHWQLNRSGQTSPEGPSGIGFPDKTFPYHLLKKQMYNISSDNDENTYGENSNPKTDKKTNVEDIEQYVGRVDGSAIKIGDDHNEAVEGSSGVRNLGTNIPKTGLDTEDQDDDVDQYNYLNSPGRFLQQYPPFLSSPDRVSRSRVYRRRSPKKTYDPNLRPYSPIKRFAPYASKSTQNRSRSPDLYKQRGSRDSSPKRSDQSRYKINLEAFNARREMFNEALKSKKTFSPRRISNLTQNHLQSKAAEVRYVDNVGRCLKDLLSDSNEWCPAMMKRYNDHRKHCSKALLRPMPVDCEVQTTTRMWEGRQSPGTGTRQPSPAVSRASCTNCPRCNKPMPCDCSKILYKSLFNNTKAIFAPGPCEFGPYANDDNGEEACISLDEILNKNIDEVMREWRIYLPVLGCQAAEVRDQIIDHLTEELKGVKDNEDFEDVARNATLEHLNHMPLRVPNNSDPEGFKNERADILVSMLKEALRRKDLFFIEVSKWFDQLPLCPFDEKGRPLMKQIALANIAEKLRPTVLDRDSEVEVYVEDLRHEICAIMHELPLQVIDLRMFNQLIDDLVHNLVFLPDINVESKTKTEKEALKILQETAEFESFSGSEKEKAMQQFAQRITDIDEQGLDTDDRNNEIKYEVEHLMTTIPLEKTLKAYIIREILSAVEDIPGISAIAVKTEYDRPIEKLVKYIMSLEQVGFDEKDVVLAVKSEITKILHKVSAREDVNIAPDVLDDVTNKVFDKVNDAAVYINEHGKGIVYLQNDYKDEIKSMFRSIPHLGDIPEKKIHQTTVNNLAEVLAYVQRGRLDDKNVENIAKKSITMHLESMFLKEDALVPLQVKDTIAGELLERIKERTNVARNLGQVSHDMEDEFKNDIRDVMVTLPGFSNLIYDKSVDNSMRKLAKKIKHLEKQGLENYDVKNELKQAINNWIQSVLDKSYINIPATVKDVTINEIVNKLIYRARLIKKEDLKDLERSNKKQIIEALDGAPELQHILNKKQHQNPLNNLARTIADLQQENLDKQEVKENAVEKIRSWLEKTLDDEHINTSSEDKENLIQVVFNQLSASADLAKALGYTVINIEKKFEDNIKYWIETTPELAPLLNKKGIQNKIHNFSKRLASIEDYSIEDLGVQTALKENIQHWLGTELGDNGLLQTGKRGAIAENLLNKLVYASEQAKANGKPANLDKNFTKTVTDWVNEYLPCVLNKKDNKKLLQSLCKEVVKLYTSSLDDEEVKKQWKLELKKFLNTIMHKENFKMSAKVKADAIENLLNDLTEKGQSVQSLAIPLIDIKDKLLEEIHDIIKSSSDMKDALHKREYRKIIAELANDLTDLLKSQLNKEDVKEEAKEKITNKLEHILDKLDVDISTSEKEKLEQELTNKFVDIEEEYEKVGPKIDMSRFISNCVYNTDWLKRYSDLPDVLSKLEHQKSTKDLVNTLADLEIEDFNNEEVKEQAETAIKIWLDTTLHKEKVDLNEEDKNRAIHDLTDTLTKKSEIAKIISNEPKLVEIFVNTIQTFTKNIPKKDNQKAVKTLAKYLTKHGLSGLFDENSNKYTKHKIKRWLDTVSTQEGTRLNNKDKEILADKIMDQVIDKIENVHTNVEVMSEMQTELVQNINQWIKDSAEIPDALAKPEHKVLTSKLVREGTLLQLRGLDETSKKLAKEQLAKWLNELLSEESIQKTTEEKSKTIDTLFDMMDDKMKEYHTRINEMNALKNKIEESLGNAVKSIPGLPPDLLKNKEHQKSLKQLADALAILQTSKLDDETIKRKAMKKIVTWLDEVLGIALIQMIPEQRAAAIDILMNNSFINIKRETENVRKSSNEKENLPSKALVSDQQLGRLKSTEGFVSEHDLERVEGICTIDDNSSIDLKPTTSKHILKNNEHAETIRLLVQKLDILKRSGFDIPNIEKAKDIIGKSLDDMLAKEGREMSPEQKVQAVNKVLGDFINISEGREVTEDEKTRAVGNTLDRILYRSDSVHLFLEKSVMSELTKSFTDIGIPTNILAKNEHMASIKEIVNKLEELKIKDLSIPAHMAEAKKEVEKMIDAILNTEGLNITPEAKEIMVKLIMSRIVNCPINEVRKKGMQDTKSVVDKYMANIREWFDKNPDLSDDNKAYNETMMIKLSKKIENHVETGEDVKNRVLKTIRDWLRNVYRQKNKNLKPKVEEQKASELYDKISRYSQDSRRPSDHGPSDLSKQYSTHESGRDKHLSKKSYSSHLYTHLAKNDGNLHQEMRNIMEKYGFSDSMKNAITDEVYQRALDIYSKRLTNIEEKKELKKMILGVLKKHGVGKDQTSLISKSVTDLLTDQTMRMYKDELGKGSLSNIFHHQGLTPLKPEQRDEFQILAKDEFTDFVRENIAGDLTDEMIGKLDHVGNELAEQLLWIYDDGEVSNTEKKDPMTKPVVNTLKQFPLMPENTAEELGEIYVDKLLKNVKNAGMITSTPRASDTKDKPMFSAEVAARGDKMADDEKQYADQVHEIAEEWVTGLPIIQDDVQNKHVKDALTDRLTYNVIDRQKYLQASPDTKPSIEQELEHLKYHIYRDFSKILGIDDPTSYVPYVADLMDKIRTVAVPRLLKPSSKAIQDEILKYIHDVSDSMRISTDLHYERNKVQELADQILADISQPDVDTTVEGDISRWMPQIFIAPPTELYKMAHDLKDILKELGLLDDKSGTNNNTRTSRSSRTSGQQSAENKSVGIGKYRKATDELNDVIVQWCEDLPIQLGGRSASVSSMGGQDKTKATKLNLASKIINKVVELNMSPEIFNDDFIYDDMLVDELDKLLEMLPVNPELEKYLPSLKRDLICHIKKARQKIMDELSGQAYKQQLRDALSATAVECLPSEEIESFELLKERLVDAYISLNYSAYNDQEKRKYKQKINAEIIRFCNEYLRRHPCAPLDTKALNRDLLAALQKVSTPKEESMRLEVEQMRIKNIISDWMKGVPLTDIKKTSDLLQQSKMTCLLAKRLFELERERDVDPNSDNQSKMHEEITKWLRKIPIRAGCEQDIDYHADALIEMLRNTEETRKQADCCCPGQIVAPPIPIAMPPCTLTNDDMSHLRRIKERAKARARRANIKDACVNAIPLDASSQTEVRPWCSPRWYPPNGSGPNSPAPGPCTPRVIVKEYVWDSTIDPNISDQFGMPCCRTRASQCRTSAQGFNSSQAVQSSRTRIGSQQGMAGSSNQGMTRRASQTAGGTQTVGSSPDVTGNQSMGNAINGSTSHLAQNGAQRMSQHDGMPQPHASGMQLQNTPHSCCADPPTTQPCWRCHRSPMVSSEDDLDGEVVTCIRRKVCPATRRRSQDVMERSRCVEPEDQWEPASRSQRISIPCEYDKCMKDELRTARKKCASQVRKAGCNCCERHSPSNWNRPAGREKSKYHDKCPYPSYMFYK